MAWLHSPSYSLCKSHLEIVKLIASKPECNKEAKDKYGNRPIHVAAKFSSNTDLISYLVEVACCNVNAKGQHGYTPLQIAYSKKNIKLAKYFTSHPDCNTTPSLTGGGSHSYHKLQKIDYHHQKF